ncbi:hypothetical protein KCU60_g16703, partial [Aureobasidium melanogenum]
MTPSQSSQLAGTKRKSTDSSDLPTINLDDYDIPDGQPMDSCTVVRGKINRFLQAGEMKIGQFCDAIGVSQNAYRRFMSQDGNNIHLDGEETDSVEVYDSCDEIRKKIAAHIRKPGATAAQFCRDLLAQYHSDKKPPQIQSGQLTKFRGYKGADTGNTSCVFYAAYVFFEKMRLAE